MVPQAPIMLDANQNTLFTSPWRTVGLDHLSRPSRLLLADSLLELGDLRGAHEAISGLYDQCLPLAEGLSLLAVQLDYLAGVAAWPVMLEGVMEKVQMAELMPTSAAARRRIWRWRR